MKDTIKLQGIHGQQQGTKVKDLRIGCIIIWNYGYKSEVVELVPSKTGKSYTMKCKDLQDGIVRDRKAGANTLFVIEKIEEVKELEQPISSIQKAINERERTYNSIYSDIGLVLDNFSTMELAEHYINICGTDSALRYYVEQEIIKHEINKERAGNPQW